jgi:hypothetical protein
MKRDIRSALRGSLIGVVVALACGSVILLGQQIFPGATPTQSVQPLYNCNQTATATGAANTAVTATLTPPAGQYAYICTIDIQEVANAAVTGAAGPAPVFTTTNLPTNLVWWGNNATITTGVSVNVLTGIYPLTLKSATAGTAFTIVTSAGQSTQSVRINVTAYFAP